MAIGVAVANAILLVTFAERHRREEGADAAQAAVEGARGRLRPILMTSCAMIAGMVPMALGWAKGASRPPRWAGPSSAAWPPRRSRPWSCCPPSSRSSRAARDRESASLDPDDPESPHYHEEEDVSRGDTQRTAEIRRDDQERIDRGARCSTPTRHDTRLRRRLPRLRIRQLGSSAYLA